MTSSGDTIINLNFKEEDWIDQTKNALNKELSHGHEFDNHVCIFQVPESVRLMKAEAYIPQTVAIGPYHHFLPKLYKMQRCKLRQVQMVHKQLNLPEFQILFDQIMGKVKDIRGYYYDNLDIHDDTLSWIVIIGGLFLLQLICKEAEGTADLMEFFDSLGGRFSMDAILKDVVMIENQIPFFVLEHLVARSHAASEISKSLLSMSMKFCTRISPIVLKGVFFKKEIEYPFHLLDLLYSLVWHGGWYMDMAGGAATRSGDIWCDLWGLIKTLNLNIPVKIIDLVLKILEKLGISVSFPAEEEKVLIPTASQLSSVNVKFCSNTTLGIKFIFFNKNNATLSLPILKLKINISEVIIRNLLAYEPIANPEIQNFARYIELMGAMIHTVEDVNLLKENKF